MPVKFTNETVFDGFAELTGGVNSGWTPGIIPNDTLSFAWNCTVRGGNVTHRPGRKRIPLNFGTNSIAANRFVNGRYQEAEFYQPDNGEPYIVAAISGRLFKVAPGTEQASVQEITISHQTVVAADFFVPILNGTVIVSVTDTTNIKANVTVAIGGTQFRVDSVTDSTTLVLQNLDATPGALIPAGSALIFYDVNPATRPQGWMCQAEKWLIVQDGQSVPIIWDGAQARRSVRTLNQIQAGKMMAYHLGRVVKVNPDGRTFSIGDLVYSGSSGTTGEAHRDAVLYVKENTYLSGGGFFTVPGNYGEITFVKGVAILDASLGQGPLQVGTTKVIFSCNLPVDRTTWQNLENPILTVSQITNGGSSQNASVLVNGDLFYRSGDSSVRSLVLGIREFTTSWGNAPVSREMNRILPFDDKRLLRYASGVLFDNRLLMTTSPSYSSRGVYHRGLVSLDFDVLSSMRDKKPAAWDGLWTGVNTLKILSAPFSQGERCFEMVLTGDGQIELWELTTDENNDRANVPIYWALETADMFRKGQNFNELDLKRLLNGELHVEDIKGRVDFWVSFRPDQHPCWIPWRHWYVCAKEAECVVDENGCSSTATYQPQYRRRLPFGQPTDDCDPTTDRPYREGGTFQVRIEVMGSCKIAALKLMAVLVPESTFGEIDETCIDATCDAGAGEVTTYLNTEQSYTATCPDSEPFGDPVTVTVAAGTFASTVSVEAANAAALAAAQAKAENEIICDTIELLPPIDVAASSTGIAEITVTWTNVEDEGSGVKIERKEGVGGTWTEIDSVALGVSDYVDTAVEEGLTYYYRLRAYDSIRDGAYSSEASATASGARLFAGGVLLEKTIAETATNTVPVYITWDAAVYDTHGLWTSGSQVVIPASLDGKYVQFLAGIRWESIASATLRFATVRKNGTLTVGCGADALSAPGTVTRGCCCVPTAPVQVATGDYFEAMGFQFSGGDLDIEGLTATFFSMQVLDPLNGLAMVQKSIAQSTASGVAETVDWETEVVDTGGFWDVGSPQIFTIPSGVSRIRLYTGISWGSWTANARVIQIQKNGAEFIGGATQRINSGSGTADQIASTPVIVVSPGDTFQVVARQSSTTLNIEANARTYFALEVIE